MIQHLPQILHFASNVTDPDRWSGWDKLGAVAVCMAMLFMMVLLHRAGLKRVDVVSDRHMKFVESQTAVMTQLVTKIEQSYESANKVHERMDRILECRQPRCPVNLWLRSNGAGSAPPTGDPHQQP